MHCLPRLLALTLPLLPALGQNAIGITSAGDIFRVDTANGSLTPLASGQTNKNCITFDNDNRLWAVARMSPILPNLHLVTIDPFTGATTSQFGFTTVGNIRALAPDLATGDLFGILNATPSDQLVRISTTTGAVTVIGPTGFADVEGLDNSAATGLIAWDQNVGLLQIDPQTGTGTDPFPATVTPVGMQFLTHNPANGQVVTGGAELRFVSLTTGGASVISIVAGGTVLKGLVFTTARVETFGTGCPGALGPGQFTLVGNFVAGSTLVLDSSGHAPNQVGLEVIGLSDDSYLGAPLPASVDPVFGTQGCFLNVSVDLTIAGITNGTGHLFVGMPTTPAMAFRQFYAQHAVLEPVPGGISFSKGMRLRSAL